MIVTLWLSGENESLARAEATAVAQRLGGRAVDPPDHGETPGRGWVELPDRDAAVRMAQRLALTRRCAVPWPDLDLPALAARLREAGTLGTTAAVQWVSRSPGERPPETLRQLGHAYVSGGGRIALERPDRRFWLETAPQGKLRLSEQVGYVDRVASSARRRSALPFRRPVTLAPHLARAVVNLARVGAGDRVVDPFVGTGSLLLEAALLGARTVGVDMNATMIRGALENFAALGQTPETLRQADAEEAAAEFPEDSFDALVTDPPYGRASGTKGEAPERLLGRALVAWSRKVRPGGCLSVVVPAGTALPLLDAQLELAIPQRVHRSLTREFRVYRRAFPPVRAQ